MTEKKEVIRIFTSPNKAGESQVAASSNLRLMVGDIVIDDVFSVDIEKIEPNNIITAVIRVAVTLGDK